MAASLLASALAATALAVPGPRQLTVHPAVNASTVERMIAQCDVRGKFGDGVSLTDEGDSLLVSFGDCAVAPAGALPLGVLNTTQEYYVLLEYQPAPKDEPVEEWAANVVATAPESMRVLYHTMDSARMLVSFPTSVIQQLPSGMPLATEYLMLASASMRPRSTHSILAAKLEAAQAHDNQTEFADPAIIRALNEITESTLTRELAMLTTTWNTRNSFSVEAEESAVVIGAMFERWGFEVAFETAREDMSPNVIATMRGMEEPDRWVVLGAHYDSRGVDNQSPTEPSPGANDDGTGTAALLEIARAISESGITFKYSLMLCAFTGEEQGLFGSRAKAEEQAEEGLDILAMFALDMLAYRREGVQPQVGLPIRNHDHVLSLFTGLMFNRYVPAVTVCTTTACCSDNTAYHEQGFSSTFIFESCPGEPRLCKADLSPAPPRCPYS